LAYLRTNNFIEDSKLAVSSNRLSEAQFGINHGRRIGSAFVNVDLGMQNGIGAFDAQRENQRRDAFGNLTPDARYRKYTATISYLQPFQLWDESLVFSSLVTGQRSKDVLFSPQRMSLGSQSSIRGYKDQTLTGDSGGYWRNDLRWSRPVKWAWLRPLLTEYGTGLGYDIGVIRNDRYNAEQHGRMSSNSLELFARGQHLAASVTFAHSLEEQTSITGKNKVDIRTENHTQLDGAVIAADNGNLKLDTGTLGFSDIAGKDKEHGYYLNVGGTYGNGGTPQDGSQVGKGKEGQSGWSVEGWNYEKDREQIVRATVGAGEIIVRNDAQTGADSTAGLNRDVNKAYEITKDEEERTDLYASSSSIKAVLNPIETLQGWKDSVAKYGENSEEALHKLGDLLLVTAALGSGTGAELVNNQQADRELTRQLGNRNENTRATTIKALLGRLAPGEEGKDFELVAQRLTDMGGQDPEKVKQILTVMYRMNLLQQTQQSFVPVLVAGTVLLGALATSLAATQLPPERQAEMQAAVSSAIDSIETNVRDVNQRAEMVKLIVDVALANLGLPIHVLDPRLKKYEGLLVEAGKQNPSSGGYGEGGQAATTPHTGGNQLDGQQDGNVYVTPGHQLNPGAVYNESANADGAKGISITIEPKIADQMGKRGWTESSIQSAIDNPVKTVVTKDTRFDTVSGSRLNDPATGYIIEDGSYVVRNDRTGAIVQVSNKNDPEWVAPWN